MSHSSTDDDHKPKRSRLDIEDNDVYPNSIEADSDYSKGGLANSLHGNIYQLKLQMLFLKRALDQGYAFNLGTEVEDAEKFDDIVFKYKSKSGDVEDAIRFVQAKHKQDESQKITAHDLLTDKNAAKNDFSLQKYFISYRNIKKKPVYNGLKFKDFILYTNIDFDYENLTQSLIKTDPIIESDKILDITKSGISAVRHKLIIPNGHELYEKLREVSDLYLLAKQLALHISKNTKLELRSDIFKLYHEVLSKKVFEIKEKKEDQSGKEVTKKYAKFRDDFCNGTTLSEDVTQFRNALKLALGKGENESAFQELLKQKELSIVLNFDAVFELKNNPTITDPERLAENIVQLISEAPEKIVSIARQSRKTGGVIKDNIDKLAGHIFVLAGELDEKNNNLIKFSKLFLDDDNNGKLFKDLKTFKDALEVALQKAKIDFDALKYLKFKINNFRTCEETREGKLLLPKDKLPTDEIEDSEIEDFFKELTFAVNQPNEVGIGEIITKELGENSQFNLLDADLVAASFQSKMLDWFKAKGKEKGKEGVWLKKENGRTLFDGIENQVNDLISVGISLAYSEKLREYGMKFKNNNLSYLEKFKDFISPQNTSKNLLHITVQETTLLSTIKVNDVLEALKLQEGLSQYKKHDSYIFMHLKELLLPKTQKYVMNSFKSEKSYNLFIIDCAPFIPENKIQSLYQKLSEGLSIKNKRIILIAKKDHILAGKFPLKDELPDVISFNDLDEASQKKVLAQEIVLQGQKVNLNKLIDTSDKKIKEIIDVEMLVKLLKGEEIIIGSKVEALGEVSSYYIDRRVKEVIFNKKKIKKSLEEDSRNSDIFVISGTDSGLKDNNCNIRVFANAELAGRMFNELCEKHPSFNIHWLNSSSKKLTWYKSYGSISKLVRCKVKLIEIVNTRSLPLKEVLDDNHKLVIISAKPGMGKSTALTSLSMELKEKDPSLWVIKINLNEHTRTLYNRKSLNLKFNKDLHQVVNFLLASQIQSNLKTNVEQELFKNSFNSSGKIALLFDGFDEISPDYKDIIIDLLQSLKVSKVKKLFVTTRSNMCEELEGALGVFSYVLDPILPIEQIEFLTKFWTKKLGLENQNQKYTERLKTYARSMIKQLSESINDKQQMLFAVPLHTSMIAEVFQQDQEGIVSEWQSCKEFLKSKDNEPNLPENFELYHLYEYFVNKKFFQLHLQDKKGRDFTKIGEKESASKDYKEFEGNHEILALHMLFTEEISNALMIEKEIKQRNRLIKNIECNKHNEGIVYQIIDNKPYFTHRTFAEYFVANRIYNWFKQSNDKPEILARILIEKYYEVIQKLFDQKLQKSPIYQWNKIFSSLIVRVYKDHPYRVFETIASDKFHYTEGLLQELYNEYYEFFEKFYSLDLEVETVHILLHVIPEEERFEECQKLWNEILTSTAYDDLDNKIEVYLEILTLEALQEPLKDILRNIPSAYPSEHDSDGNSRTSQEVETDLYINGTDYVLTEIKYELKMKYIIDSSESEPLISLPSSVSCSSDSNEENINEEDISEEDISEEDISQFPSSPPL